MAPLLLLGGAAFGLLCIWVWSSILSVAWSSTLSKIPNAHWTSPYSRWWQLRKAWAGLDNASRLEAHRKHGPVVRIGPKEISVNCIEGGVQTVYGGNWDKSGIYEMFTNYDQPVMVGLVNAKTHAERKRMLAHVYTKTYVDNSKDLAEILGVMESDRLAPLLRTWAKERKAVNVLPLAECYSMDIMTAYLYGLENATNWTENPEEAQFYLDAFRASMSPDTFLLVEIPTITVLLSSIGLNIVPPRVFESFDTRLSFGRMLSDRTHKALDNPSSTSSSRTPPPIVYSHFRSKLHQSPSTPPPQINDILAAELLDHVHAGHEGPGLLVTYFLWEMAKSPSHQAALRNELRALRAQGKNPASASALLDDMLQETMRLHPPVWGPFPRVSPQEGGRLGGFEIPPGMTVSASPYSLGRNEGVFPDAEMWRPERWGEASPEGRREMERWVWGYGSGSRVCIGRHLATAAMKSMLVTILEEFGTTVAEESDMTHVEGLISWPKNMRLMLRFSQV